MFWILLTIISLILSAFFSGVEIAFITSDRVRVGLDSSRGGLINGIISRYYGHQEFFISTILVGNNIMLVIYGMGAAALLEPWIAAHITSNQALILLLQTLISTLVILFTGEFIPKSIFRINPYRSLKLSALPVFLFYIILYPVAWFTSWLSKVLMRSALQELAPEVETVSTTTFRAEDAADTGYREDLLALGFAEAEMLEEFGYPTQRLLAAKSVLKEACDAR